MKACRGISSRLVTSQVFMQVAQIVLLSTRVVASCQAQTGEAVSGPVFRAPSPAASLAADAFVMPA